MRDAAPSSSQRFRRAALLALLASACTAAGCATKSDIRTLQQDIAALRTRQDSVFRETQRQTRLLLDTLRTSFAIQQDVRGETSHRFQQLEQNLAQLEALISQTQLMIGQLNERLDRMSMQPIAGGAGISPPDPSAPPGEADGIYTTGMQLLSDGSVEAARAAFQEIVTRYPNDPRAPEAQYQVGETYYQQEEYERAIEEFEKVESQWPRAPRAPDALLRAGIIAQEQNQTSAARRFFQRVTQQFPNTDAAREASRRLRQIRG
jgi:tol-pal system protein YbgF